MKIINLKFVKISDSDFIKGGNFYDLTFNKIRIGGNFSKEFLQYNLKKKTLKSFIRKNKPL